MSLWFLEAKICAREAIIILPGPQKAIDSEWSFSLSAPARCPQPGIAPAPSAKLLVLFLVVGWILQLSRNPTRASVPSIAFDWRKSNPMAQSQFPRSCPPSWSQPRLYAYRSVPSTPTTSFTHNMIEKPTSKRLFRWFSNLESFFGVVKICSSNRRTCGRGVQALAGDP